MADVTIDFPTLTAALVFLQRESPASPDDAWARLGKILLLRNATGPVVALQFGMGTLDEAGVSRAVRCGGILQKSGAQSGPWTENVSMQVFFRRVRLETSNRTDQGRRFLIIPVGSKAECISQIMEWLSEVEGCSVWVWEVCTPGVDVTVTVFELNAEGDAPIPAPAGLPGAPHVLVGIDDDVFVPAGLDCPLLPAHRFLFPPAGDGRLHVWVVEQNGRPSYVELRTAAVGTIPMARLVMLPAEASVAPVATGAQGGRVTLPLRLRPINARRKLRRAAQVLYVVESRGGELGAALLRLFDHTEAGIEQFTYFNRVAGAGPNALVEHFLLTDSRIADDDMWPELRRFDMPRALAEVGLPVFLPADADFTPDIEGVITGLDADDPFLSALRSIVGLDDAPADRMAMIEPSSAGGSWRITTLEKGRPLESLIAVVIEDWNREPIRRLLDTERVDLTSDRRRYEEQWLAVGSRESAELASTTRVLAESLAESVTLVARQLTDLETRVEVLREVSVSGQQLVSAAPRQVAAFIDALTTMVTALATPRQEWLLAAEARRQAMQSLVAGAQSLQQSAQEQIERANTSVTEAGRALSTAGDRITQARTTLERSMSELDPQVDMAQTAAQQASVAIQGRHERVLATQAGVAASERALRDRSAEVDRLQQAVQSREQAVARASEALSARRASLETRMTAAQLAESAARAEEERLRQVEAIELPSAVRRRADAEQELMRWRTKRLDERVRDVEAEIRLRDQECSKLKDQHEQLDRMCTELARLQSEAERFRESVAQLRKMDVEAAVQVASTELTELSSDVLLLQAIAASLQKARHSLDTAASSFQQVQRRRELEDVGLKIDELERQTRSLEAEHRHASKKELPANLETRIEEIEQIARDLRRRNSGARSRWFGQWFGGSRS